MITTSVRPVSGIPETESAGYPLLDLLSVATSSLLSYHVPNVTAEGSLSVGEFGDKFRKARESKELSLDDVSNVTKIGTRMLQAIEEERFDRLPGGVFNKGFIRAYSKHLGLNSEDVITEYLACLRQAQIDAQQIDAQRIGAQKIGAPEVWQPGGAVRPRPLAPVKAVAASLAKNAVPPTAPVEVEDLPELQIPRAEDMRPSGNVFGEKTSAGFPWKLVVAAAVVVVVVVAILFWFRHARTGRIVAAQANTPAVAQPAVSATSAVQNPSSGTQSPAPGSATAASPRGATQKAQPPQPVAQPAEIHPRSLASTTTAKVEEKGDVTIRSFGNAAAKISERPAASLSLVVRATENSWVSVFSDGQLVTQETLIAPAHTTVRASREIVVKVGNAAGVAFLWNGQDVPAQGAESEVKTFTFDSAGMHTAPAQTPTVNQ